MRFIIQVERPEWVQKRPAIPEISRLLEGTGVDLDVSYGPIPINPSLGRFVVRGEATPEAKSKAEAVAGVHLFSDPTQEPA